jgi:hypothetical protein
MKHLFLTVALCAVPYAASAGTIERACLGSDRSAANPQLCACIQQAADLTLTNRDQSRAAKFFRDPHQAQEVRQSDRASDEEFWRRYRSFGDTAEAFCSGT